MIGLVDDMSKLIDDYNARKAEKNLDLPF